MNKKIPVVRINENDKIWLEEVYSQFNKNKTPTQRQIWSKLYGKLPSSFTPVSIDSRLIRASGERITILGIIAIERSLSIIEQIDKIIFAIKKYLLDHPEETEIVFEPIAKECDIELSKASRFFELACEYGNFYSGISSEGEVIKSIGIGNESQYYSSYLYFNGISTLIHSFLSEKKRNENRNISVSESTINTNPNAISVTPHFTTRIQDINEGLCFVLMPFTLSWSDRVYNTLIKKNVEKLGLKCTRADNLNGPIIIEDIWIQINRSAIIIADVTNKNPNVMYELGIVHTLGKPVILITQDVKDRPFDFSHLRHYQYADNADSFKSFGIELRKLIRSLHNEKYPESQVFKEI